MLALLIALACQDEVKVTPKEKLEGAAAMPAVVSPDGKSILYFRQADRKFVYVLADADGKGARDLYASGVDWDDILNGTTGASTFSADGTRVAVLGTKDDQAHRKEKDPLRALACGLDGKAVKIDADGDALAVAFAGDRVIFIDSKMPEMEGESPGYKLKAWDGKATAVVLDVARDGAFSLTASPDGARAAFITMGADGMRVRVVDLKSGAAADSEAFRSDDVTFDGAPVIYWDAAGKGVYAHRCPVRGKKPFSLVRFDPEKALETLLEDKNVAVTAALDAEHLAVVLVDEKRGGVLRLADRKIFRLPENQWVLGGRGRRVVLYDQKAREARVAEIAW